MWLSLAVSGAVEGPVCGASRCLPLGMGAVMPLPGITFHARPLWYCVSSTMLPLVCRMG
jgi:hypothetical protein